MPTETYSASARSGGSIRWISGGRNEGASGVRLTPSVLWSAASQMLPVACIAECLVADESGHPIPAFGSPLWVDYGRTRLTLQSRGLDQKTQLTICSLPVRLNTFHIRPIVSKWCGESACDARNGLSATSAVVRYFLSFPWLVTPFTRRLRVNRRYEQWRRLH